MAEKPALQTAETDKPGPVKRRRRPALSCVECRMRKVKCDREKPCTPCTRIRAGTCTYRPYRQGFRVHASETPEVLVDRIEAPTLNVVSDPGGSSTTSCVLLQRVKALEIELATIRSKDQIADAIREGDSGIPAGQFLKSKFYGNSHWMNAMEPYDALSSKDTTINTGTNRKEVDQSSELYTTVSGVKRMARIIKTSRMLQPSLLPEVVECIPPKDVCDQLVVGYLRTFEGMFRILHVPSFRKEYEAYWTSSAPAKPSMLIKILLVCAIGLPFFTGPSQAKLRGPAAKWIQAAIDWQNGPHVKSRLNMTGLQIQILTILAKQVCAIDGDHVWISAGSLLRTAMTLGLHRDPSNFGNISTFHAEMRRRLWATVLEMTVQCSLDMGMPPMIADEDYDTRPPANVNDEDIGEGSAEPLNVWVDTVFTETSVQIASLRSLSLRLEIVRLINRLHFELPYSEVIRLGSELTTQSHRQIAFLKSALAADLNITPFKIKLLESLTRRFILCLHRPFFSEAFRNPQYYYSRKVCLDNSLAIFTPATSVQPGEQDDWTRLTHKCVGLFKSVMLFALSTVYFELQAQIREHQEHDNLPLNTGDFKTLRGILVSVHATTLARLRNGETNAKGAVFLACALARVDAMQTGEDVDRAVLKAAKDTISETTIILQNVYREEHGRDIDLYPSSGPFAHRLQGRGEGADDVTGRHLRTGTRTDDADELGVQDLSLSQELGGSDGLGALTEWSGMDMDFDLNTYLEGESVSADSDFHFGRSPDWLFDSSGWADGCEGFSG